MNIQLKNICLNVPVNALWIDHEKSLHEIINNEIKNCQIVKNDNEISDDIVHEFHLSDEEDDNEIIEKNDVKIHTLIINRDIDVHCPPNIIRNDNQKKSEVEFCNMRPILKPPSMSPRSCRGSQTDISAIGQCHVSESTGN